MADWQSVTIPAGETESAEIAIPADEIEVPPGQVTNASGQKAKIQGNDFDVVATDGDGSKIVLEQPAAEDLVFKYKGADDDDDDEPEPEQLPA